jgi:hypothetical protein
MKYHTVMAVVKKKKQMKTIVGKNMKLENSQVLDKDIKRCILNGKLLVIFQKLNCKAIC